MRTLTPEEPETVRDAGGNIVRARLDWMKSDGGTLLGSIVMEGTRLIAETNSEERAGRLHALIEKALPAGVRHRVSEITSMERLLADARESGKIAGSPEEVAASPEAVAVIAAMLERHYAGWVNEKIPALGGKTPRQAMRTAGGREKVEALVRQIEADGARMSPPLDPAFVRRLRERLGLEQPGA